MFLGMLHSDQGIGVGWVTYHQDLTLSSSIFTYGLASGSEDLAILS